MDRQSGKQQPNKQPFVVKVYLVFVPINTAKKGEYNRKVISAKLTWGAAKHIQDQIPGAEIERIFVDKEYVDVEGDFSKLEKTLRGEPDGTQSNKHRQG